MLEANQTMEDTEEEEVEAMSNDEEVNGFLKEVQRRLSRKPLKQSRVNGIFAKKKRIFLAKFYKVLFQRKILCSEML